MEIERQVAIQLFAAAGEAVDDGARELRARPLEDLDEGRVGLPLVEERGLAELRGQRELRLEASPLGRPGGEVAVEVEAAFPHRDHLGPSGERADLMGDRRRPGARVMRVDAGGAREERRPIALLLRQLVCAAARGLARPGDDDGRHARVLRAAEDRHEIAAERFVGQVGSDVDHGALSPRSGRSTA